MAARTAAAKTKTANAAQIDDHVGAGEERVPEHVTLAEKTFLGDLMTCVVEQVKVLPKSWQQLSEAEQRDYLYRVEAQMRQATKKALQILMAQDMQMVPAQVESVTFKEGVKVVLKMMSGTEGRHAIADAEGSVVNVVIGHTDHLTQGGGKPEPEKDQPDLPLDDTPDDLIAKAEAFVRGGGNPSIAALQRDLGIGYNRAARIIEALEDAGVVTEADSSGKRKVIERAPDDDSDDTDEA